MVGELLLSQQDQPHSYRLVQQTAQTGVIRIVFHGEQSTHN